MVPIICVTDDKYLWKSEVIENCQGQGVGLTVDWSKWKERVNEQIRVSVEWNQFLLKWSAHFFLKYQLSY